MRTLFQSIASPGRPPAGAGRDARELLLNAATELFAEHGVAATTFAMIAKRAGLTPAMLHYYFTDRDQLCDAVVDERILRVIAQVWDPVDPEAGAADTIRGIVERLLERIEAMPWIPSLWIREILNEGGLLRERLVRRAPFDILRPLVDAVARGQAHGTLNPEINPVLLAISTIGLVMLNVTATKFLPRVLDSKPINTQTVQHHVIGLLLGGLGGKKPLRSNASSRKKSR